MADDHLIDMFYGIFLKNGSHTILVIFMKDKFFIKERYGESF